MKDKIFQSLKQAYSSLGLSDEILQGQADALVASGLVTDENLATVVQGQSSFLSSLQSGIDKRVTDAVNKAKEKKEETKGGAEQPDIQRMIDAAIEAKVAPLQSKLNDYEANEAKATRANLISSKAKELGIPEWRMKEGFAISDDMDETAINTYLSGVKQNIVTAGLEGKGSAGILSTSDNKAKEEAESWANNLSSTK